MENRLAQLLAALKESPVSADVLHQITVFLQRQTEQSIPSCLSQSFQSLLALHQWSWKLFSEDPHPWIDDYSYRELFSTIASFDKTLIFDGNINTDTKAALVFSVTIDQINRIFAQLDQRMADDENDPFLDLISLWLNNHSYFLFDQLEYNVLPIIDHIGQCIVRQYIMSKRYKLYLAALHHSSLPDSLFTARMLFYIKTCSFYSYTYLNCSAHHFPCTTLEMINYLTEDYLQIIHVHRSLIASWHPKLVGCIGHLIGFMVLACWRDGQVEIKIKEMFPAEQMICDHVQDLIQILAHQPFYKDIRSGRSNDATVLLHASVMFLIVTVQAQNINWFFRSNPSVRETLVHLAETVRNEQICLSAYNILGETLTDDQLKHLEMGDHISRYCFEILEDAWNRPWKKFRKIPIEIVLKGFQCLAKTDAMQQKAAASNKISLFIELSDQYSVALDIIWAFSFNADIQQQLRSNATFMSKLAQLTKESTDKQRTKIVHGILWNLETNHDDRLPAAAHDGTMFDIMISYSHKEKAFCQQLYEELTKASYRVWIDFDQMHGNVMDAMAQAIERSPTIIICISEQYRKSNYCRAEAHYAFQCQRKIIPIVAQKHYKPDGWLLFLIGQLLYVDFTKHEFPRAMSMLLKELTAKDVVQSDGPTAQVQKDSPNILDWSPAQVQEWLMDHNLFQIARLFADCDGRSLMYLQNCVKHGELRCVLNSLQEDSLRRTNQNLSIIELSCFLSLMRQQKRLAQSILSTRLKKLDQNTNL